MGVDGGDGHQRFSLWWRLLVLPFDVKNEPAHIAYQAPWARLLTVYLVYLFLHPVLSLRPQPVYFSLCLRTQAVNLFFRLLSNFVLYILLNVLGDPAGGHTEDQG